MRKIFSWILTLTLALALALCACGQDIATAWQEQYDLGIKYLSEGNYEEAIIAFTAAIEIDPKQPEAYFGRGQSYYGVAVLLNSGGSADFLEDVDTPEDPLAYCYLQAIRDYEQAIELNPQTAEYYDEIMKVALEYGDIDLMIHYGELKYQNTDDTGLEDLFEAAKISSALMDELAAAFAGGSDEEIFALMQGEKYAALLSLQEYLGRPILRAYDGQTLGIYWVETAKYGHCMIYYGGFADGVRSGQGAWYGYSDGNNYASLGDWAGDMPNGAFETKEWNSDLNESVTYRLVSGDVTDGLWDGAVLWAFDSTDGYQSWNCTFHGGLGEIVKIEEKDGKTRYFWSEQSNEGEQSLSAKEGTENQLRGIPGFVPVYEYE